MRNIDVLRGILEEFAAATGLESLSLDENNCCSIAIGEDTVLHLCFKPESGALMLSGAVGVLPEDEETESDVMRFLLVSNLYGLETDGATLSLEPEGGIVVLHRDWGPDEADGAALSREIQRFAELLHHWQNTYQAMLEESNDGVAPFEDFDEAESLPMHGLIA